MSERVTLFSLKAAHITIEMQLYFTPEGQLFFEGYDIGPAVEDAWGDSDYEYSYTIEPGEVTKLYPLFGVEPGNRSALLQAIRAKFHTNFAYSEFGKFLREHAVVFGAFSWS